MGFEALDSALQHHVIATLGWRSLRPLQERSVEPILSGDHAVLGAPTAGGKTEAALFGLLSRMTLERWSGLSVLYVCPLRALLNDLEPRVEQLAGFVGRRAALWHGDVGQSARLAILADPPDILLTTPESLEAMTISTRVDHRRLLGTVRTVVVDEVHAFAGDDRGWHLLAVLAKLDALVEEPVQRIGLTATVGNPEELLTWMVDAPAGPGPAARSSSLVAVPPAGDAEAPDIEIDWVGSVDNAAQVLHALHRGEKRLVFADSRARVEEVATALRALGTTMFVSHSSLAAGERRDAEAAFQAARDCVILATSTLELGIDVGDLDRVVQIGAPATVASLLQRMGRTGRRPGTRRNCLFLCTRDAELLQALALCDLMASSWVEPLVAPPLPVHLVAQQMLARVLSEGRVARPDWPGVLGRTFASAGIDLTALGEIVATAIDRKVLLEDGGVLAIGPAGEESFGRRHYLAVLSLFLSEPLLTVRHGRRDLGTVDPSAVQRLPNAGRPVILLGGHAWAVTEIDWSQGTIWVEPSEDPGRSRWSGAGRALSFEVCQAQRRALAGALDPGVEGSLTRRGTARLEELREELGLVPADGTWLVRDVGAGRAWWWTFAGAKANQQLAAGLEDQGVRVNVIDDLRLSLAGTVLADKLRHVDVDSAPAPDAQRIDSVKFAEMLPRSLIAEMLAARDRDVAAVRWVLASNLTNSDCLG